MELSVVQPIFQKYIENHRELEKIQKDINDYKKKFKQRLDDLKSENQTSEKILLQYLDENNLPGIRSGEFMILADEKPVQNNKTNRQAQIRLIFENHQIDTSSKIYQDIVDAVITPKIYNKMEKKIRFKKYQNEEAHQKNK